MIIFNSIWIASQIQHATKETIFYKALQFLLTLRGPWGSLRTPKKKFFLSKIKVNIVPLGVKSKFLCPFQLKPYEFQVHILSLYCLGGGPLLPLNLLTLRLRCYLGRIKEFYRFPKDAIELNSNILSIRIVFPWVGLKRVFKGSFKGS